MNINLKSLFNKDETIPELSNLITDELSDYGVCQYTLFKDGSYHLYLITDLDLTQTQLNSVKNIILNHNSLNYYKAEKIKLLKQQATSLIESKYPPFKQINAALGVYDSTKQQEILSYISDIKSQVDTIEVNILSKRTLNTLDVIEIKFT